MKIVMIHGQNHKGSSYNIGRMIANKIGGEEEKKYWENNGWFGKGRPWK